MHRANDYYANAGTAGGAGVTGLATRRGLERRESPRLETTGKERLESPAWRLGGVSFIASFIALSLQATSLASRRVGGLTDLATRPDSSTSRRLGMRD
jgi:hypothetical protein